MCSTTFIFVRSNHSGHRYHDIRSRQHPTLSGETAVNRIATVLLAASMIVLLALLAATAAGVLARLDGTTYPAALMRAATTFAASITLATAVTGVVTQLLT